MKYADPQHQQLRAKLAELERLIEDAKATHADTTPYGRLGYVPEHKRAEALGRLRAYREAEGLLRTLECEYLDTPTSRLEDTVTRALDACESCCLDDATDYERVKRTLLQNLEPETSR